MPLFFAMSMPLNLAPLNDARVQIIRDAFSHIAPSIAPLNPPLIAGSQGALIIHNNERAETAIISENQIAYNLDIVAGKIDYTRIALPLNTIFKSLLLGDVIDLNIVMRWIVESDSKNTMESTKNMFVHEIKGMLDQESGMLKGVGYRFLVQGIEVLNEVKIEPLIADASKYFVECVINRRKVAISDLESVLEDLETQQEKVVKDISLKLA